MLDLLSGATRLFLIIGDPIKYVESPVQLTRSFATRGHNAVCVPMQVPGPVLDEVMRGLSAVPNVDGLLVTMPHKLSGHGQGNVATGPPDPTGCDMVCNATPLGMNDDDPLPVDADLLTSSMFVGDVIGGHGLTPLLAAAEDAGCSTANGDQMVKAVQELMLDFMVGKRTP